MLIDSCLCLPHARRMPSPTDPVLEAARALSVRDPDWTMSALASAAGISRATLYRRFPGRDAVVAALSRTGDAPADPKTRMLDAFERVAERKGIVATTIADVADEAGGGGGGGEPRLRQPRGGRPPPPG